MRPWPLLLLLLPALAGADGMMFSARPYSPQTQEREREPSIPRQRALLKWQDGEATMIVESVLDGAPGPYGWVVPLPEKPSYVKASKPDYLRQAFARARPVPERWPEPDSRTVWFPLAWGTLALGGAAWLVRNKARGRLAAYGVATLLGALGLNASLELAGAKNAAKSSVVFKAAGARAADEAKMSFAPGVEGESLGTIGAYDVTVITGGKDDAILRWLDRQGITLSPRAAERMDEYRREGWVFLAAKFRKDTSEPVPPHPLKAVFPARELVYPMRLTGLQPDPLYLEMLIVGDRRAEVPYLETWRCDDTGWAVAVNDEPGYGNRGFEDWRYREIKGAAYGRVTTYLRGQLSPGQMNEDYPVRWTDYRAENRRLVVAETFWPAVLPGVASWFALGAWALGLGLLVRRVGSPAPYVLGGLAALALALGAEWAIHRDLRRIAQSDLEPGYFRHHP